GFCRKAAQGAEEIKGEERKGEIGYGRSNQKTAHGKKHCRGLCICHFMQINIRMRREEYYG
ncbi:MAG: hypothetical protein MR430_06920, partial [Lachnospiraceae bacterium]|nr:hypothetical protein [Lachnospiraceae bacterium]